MVRVFFFLFTADGGGGIHQKAILRGEDRREGTTPVLYMSTSGCVWKEMWGPEEKTENLHFFCVDTPFVCLFEVKVG